MKYHIGLIDEKRKHLEKKSWCNTTRYSVFEKEKEDI